ncbi:AimR family lysis-lysogeny pheromone receptor [Bacillus cereus]
MCDLLMCYLLYDTGNYRSILNYVKNAEEKVKQISVRKNRFIKSSYNHRIIEILSAIHLLRGNVNECRKFSLELIEQCGSNPQFNIQRVNAFCNLGESYIFSDYNKALNFLQKSLENLGNPFNQRLKDKKKLILQTIVFLKIHWDKPVGNLEIHSAERAYLEIKLENNKKAEEILMDLLKTQGRLSAFQKFYLGLARNDRKLLEESLEIFEEKGNIFYSQLPKRYLGYS